MESKTCKKCGVTKPRDQFWKSSDTRDGLQRWGCACGSENNKKKWRAQGGGVRVRAYTQDGRAKICFKCGVEKPLEEFGEYRRSDGKTGERRGCKECRRAYIRERGKREDIKHYRQVYNEQTRERRKERAAANYQANRE